MCFPANTAGNVPVPLTVSCTSLLSTTTTVAIVTETSIKVVTSVLPTTAAVSNAPEITTVIEASRWVLHVEYILNTKFDR